MLRRPEHSQSPARSAKLTKLDDKVRHTAEQADAVLEKPAEQ